MAGRVWPLHPLNHPVIDILKSQSILDGHDVVVVTRGLSKRFGRFAALSDCSIDVPRGEIFGLLGPNGAGKSTLIRCLLGYLQPTEGELSIAGLDPRQDGVALRQRVSYLPGDARLPRHMRGRAVLKFFSEMHPEGDFSRSKTIAERLQLDTNARVAFMSTGMRQKLALSVVFAVDSPLLILDEPTANLDPTIRGIVLELAVEARSAGRTVIFSSHVMSEIEETCDRVVFLRRGEVAHQLAMPDLFQRHRITALPPEHPIKPPREIADRVHVQTIGRLGHSLVCLDTDGDLAPLLGWIDSLGLKGIRIEPLGLRAVYDSVHHGEEVPC